jgi:hypothetical protein
MCRQLQAESHEDLPVRYLSRLPMRHPESVRRYVLAGAAGYAALSMLCVGLGHVEQVPAGVDTIAQAVVPYTFYLLGPPVTLTAGWQGLPLYAAETLILMGLVWLTLKLLSKPGEAFAVPLLATGAFWIACGFLPLIFVI